MTLVIQEGDQYLGSFLFAVKTRNKLTHGNIDYDKINVDKILWNTKDLLLILQLSILSQLGFTDADLKEIYLIEKPEKL